VEPEFAHDSSKAHDGKSSGWVEQIEIKLLLVGFRTFDPI
jgi:hypothetical protein